MYIMRDEKHQNVMQFIISSKEVGQFWSNLVKEKIVNEVDPQNSHLLRPTDPRRMTG